MAVEKAPALDERDRLRSINLAGRRGDWHADAWNLERRYRERYARQTQVTGNNGGPIEMVPREITGQDRAQRTRRIMELTVETPRQKQPSARRTRDR